MAWQLALGLGSALVGGIFGGAQQSAQNRAAERQAQLTYESNLSNWNFSKQNAKRQYKYDLQTVNIQRKNIARELNYQDKTAAKNWRYQMKIQAFDYANQIRAFEKSKQTANEQLDYNNLAYDYALQDTARWEQEQNLMLDFEEKSTMLEFRYAQRGEMINAQQAAVALQQSQAMGQIEQQKAYIEGMKQTGAAQAKGGFGVSAEKMAQASIAEMGAATSAIIQELIGAEQNYGLTMEAISTKLEQLNDTFYLDKAQLAASRDSLTGQAASMRDMAALGKKQADINALASIMLEPLKPPKIPKPKPLPRPVIQDPLKFDKKLWNSIKPKKGAAATFSPVAAGVGTFATQALGAAARAYNPQTGGFN